MTAVEVERLLHAAERAATKGRELFDCAISMRAAALAAVPAGMTLAWTLDIPSMKDVRVTRQADGSWLSPAGTARHEWVEDQWMRGNLRPADDPSPETGI